uniref:Uncharacterized protein n=1 Tax=Nothoprocta perdicaria TaxID=30464 RepID=A0A8C7EE08_NOTPE
MCAVCEAAALGLDAEESSTGPSEKKAAGEPAAPDPILRLVLAGDSGAGKSSFLLRLCVDFRVKQLLVDGEPTTLQIWDTAGQERCGFRSIARSYFRKAHGLQTGLFSLPS